ncbi:DUF6461 domain-containing protein [Streptomyces tsukubensis]
MDDNDWAWATDPRYPLWCLTFTRNLEPAEVLRRYGADPSNAQTLAHTETSHLYDLALHEGGTVLRVGALHGWTFGYEDVGGTGSHPGTLQTLSQGTETICLLRGGDGTNRLTHCINGQTRETFEPSAALTSQRPPQPHPFWNLIHTYGQQALHQPPILLALHAVTHHTHTILDRATLSGPLLSIHLANTDQPPRSAPPAPPCPPTKAMPPIGRALGSAHPLPRPEPS